jgi:hypothetical protein
MSAWYLFIVGVTPSTHGQGIGWRLIEPVLADADDAGVNCCLETFDRRKPGLLPAAWFFGRRVQRQWRAVGENERRKNSGSSLPVPLDRARQTREECLSRAALVCECTATIDAGLRIDAATDPLSFNVQAREKRTAANSANRGPDYRRADFAARPGKPSVSTLK